MAKPQSTTGARARKNRAIRPAHRKRSAARASAMGECSEAITREEDEQPPPRSLFQAIEAERSRLTTAQSVLACLREALVAAEQRRALESDFADVASVVQRLVCEAIHRLDFVFLKPLLGISRRAKRASRTRDSTEVRD